MSKAQRENDRLFFAGAVPSVGANGGVEVEVAEVDCVGHGGFFLPDFCGIGRATGSYFLSINRFFVVTYRKGLSSISRSWLC